MFIVRRVFFGLLLFVSFILWGLIEWSWTRFLSLWSRGEVLFFLILVLWVSCCSSSFRFWFRIVRSRSGVLLWSCSIVVFLLLSFLIFSFLFSFISLIVRWVIFRVLLRFFLVVEVAGGDSYSLSDFRFFEEKRIDFGEGVREGRFLFI